MAFLLHLRNVGTAGDLNCVFKKLVRSFSPCGASTKNLISKTNRVTLVIYLIFVPNITIMNILCMTIMEFFVEGI